MFFNVFKKPAVVGAYPGTRSIKPRKVYERSRKNHVFKTRGYCSCTHLGVDILLKQVDWRRIAIQHPMSLYRENRWNRPETKFPIPLKTVSNPIVNQLLFSNGMIFAFWSWIILSRPHFSTPVNNLPICGSFPGKFPIFAIVKIPILLVVFSLFSWVGLLGKFAETPYRRVFQGIQALETMNYPVEIPPFSGNFYITNLICYKHCKTLLLWKRMHVSLISTSHLQLRLGLKTKRKAPESKFLISEKFFYFWRNPKS